MARSSIAGSAYPADWPQIAQQVKRDAGNKCVRCQERHDPERGYTLTVHHLDMNPGNSAWWNLLPLCQRCHLSIQARVVIERPWVMTDHSEWFKPYVAGWYALRYLNESLTREQVMNRLTELLALERNALMGVV